MFFVHQCYSLRHGKYSQETTHRLERLPQAQNNQIMMIGTRKIGLEKNAELIQSVAEKVIDGERKRIDDSAKEESTKYFQAPY